MGLLGCVILSVLVLGCFADLHSHQYDENTKERVVVWVNKIGPYNNPQEIYPFFSLPFCKPSTEIDIWEGLGEAIQGYELIDYGINIGFKELIVRNDICSKKLNQQELEQFQFAIENQYWYQMFVDDLPVFGMVGAIIEDQPAIYTHQRFSFSYNGDRIIEVCLTHEDPKILQLDAEYEFTFSAEWTPTDVEFDVRFKKYLDFDFFEHQVHWFSMFNSIMMVIFLIGLVMMILYRSINKDFNRDEENATLDSDEANSWKHVHGDVFRRPAHLGLLSTFLGIGYQLILLVYCLLFLSMIGLYYKQRGTLVTAAVIFYSLTSFVSGYVSGGYYLRNGGKKWVRVMIMSTGLFPLILISSVILLNIVAYSYDSLNFVPFSTGLIVLVIWIVFSFPLTIAGTLIGRNASGTKEEYPCRVNQVPRPIPVRPWYYRHSAISVLAGMLPFASIFVETYYVFTALWHYKYYYVYGFSAIIFTVLILVTACVNIVATFVILNTEDHKWHWKAFSNGGSTALYVLGYNIFYYIFRTKMSGFFQFFFYFTYSTLSCVALYIICGSVAFVASSIFLKRIYKSIKSD